jgi:hypothetical protein
VTVNLTEPNFKHFIGSFLSLADSYGTNWLCVCKPNRHKTDLWPNMANLYLYNTRALCHSCNNRRDYRGVLRRESPGTEQSLLIPWAEPAHWVKMLSGLWVPVVP